MDSCQLGTILRAAETYPLPLRIAAGLSIYGVTEREFCELADADVQGSPIFNAVQNHLRDFERGAEINKTLETLATSEILNAGRIAPC